MKKIWRFIIMAIFSAALLSGCAGNSGSGGNQFEEGEEKLAPYLVEQFRPLHHPDRESVGTYMNDHTVIKEQHEGNSGLWHTIGITAPYVSQPNIERYFAHGTGVLTEQMTANTTTGGKILSGPDDKSGELAWAPHVVWDAKSKLYHMYYFTNNTDLPDGNPFKTKENMGYATSPDLVNWTNACDELKIYHKGKEGKTITYRDPCLVYLEEEERWLMYFTDINATNGRSAVGLYESEDLKRWDFAGWVLTVGGTAVHASWSSAESPFVFKKDGYYLLSLTITDSAITNYHNTYIFKSEDPRMFGTFNGNIDEDMVVTRLPLHAPEFLHDEATGKWYVTTCGWPHLSRYPEAQKGVAIAEINFRTIKETKDSGHDGVAAVYTNKSSAVDNHGFESGNLDGWTVTGAAFAKAVRNDIEVPLSKGEISENFKLDGIGSYSVNSSVCTAGDAGLGSMRSNDFILGGDGQINFHIGGGVDLHKGGGSDLNNLYIALVRISDKAQLFKATGSVINPIAVSDGLRLVRWDASAYIGEKCYILIVDNASNGHICIDEIYIPGTKL